MGLIGQLVPNLYLSERPRALRVWLSSMAVRQSRARGLRELRNFLSLAVGVWPGLAIMSHGEGSGKSRKLECCFSHRRHSGALAASYQLAFCRHTAKGGSVY